MKKENANLVVAKMDATANDVHPLFYPLIKGYPSIFFLPVNNKDEPILFNTTTSLNYKALKVHTFFYFYTNNILSFFF